MPIRPAANDTRTRARGPVAGAGSHVHVLVARHEGAGHDVRVVRARERRGVPQEAGGPKGVDVEIRKASGGDDERGGAGGANSDLEAPGVELRGRVGLGEREGGGVWSQGKEPAGWCGPRTWVTSPISDILERTVLGSPGRRPTAPLMREKGSASACLGITQQNLHETMCGTGNTGRDGHDNAPQPHDPC